MVKRKIEWYVDDQIVRTVDYSDDQRALECIDRPQYIEFNLALGGAWPGAAGENLAGTKFEVDYVRYARNEQQQKMRILSMQMLIKLVVKKMLR